MRVNTRHLEKEIKIYLVLLSILFFISIILTLKMSSNAKYVFRFQVFLGILVLLASYFRQYTTPDISREKMIIVGMIVAVCDITGISIKEGAVSAVVLGIFWTMTIILGSIVIILYNKLKYLKRRYHEAQG
ncbi:hypothetical protein [Thermococcus sp.]